MKTLLLFIGFCFAGLAINAQLRINLVVSSTPPSTLTEWANKREVLTLVVTLAGATGGSPDVKIKTEIKTLDGTVIGTTDLVKARSFRFQPGNTILTAAEVLPLENMIFTGKYRNALDKTGKLPADNYTICVQFVLPPDFRPVTEPQCKNFYLANTQLPILMKPYDGEILDGKIAQTAITFRWTPVIPRLKEPTTYRIQVFEILQSQTPLQALRANQPLLDKEVKGMTQYIWQPQLSFLPEAGDPEVETPETKWRNNNTMRSNRGENSKTDSENDSANLKWRNNNTMRSNRGDNLSSNPGLTGPVKRFIWTIQSLDPLGNPVNQTDGNGESRSEPIIFSIQPVKNAPANKEKPKDRPVKGIKDTIKTQV